MSEIVFTVTGRGTRIHKANCRYAKTGAPVDRLAVLADGKPAACCRPKPEAVDAVRDALSRREAAAKAARKPAAKAAPKRKATSAKKKPVTRKASAPARKPAAPKPEPTTSRRAKPSTKETKVFAAASTVEDQPLPAGTRCVRRNRLRSLVASADLWDGQGLEDQDGFRWGAMCITHDTTARHRTHRAAWATLAKSAEWCDGCAKGDAKAGK